ncbi:MAG: NAD-dependent epimerase/dehydratase family protein [Paracoccaceae bacterium]|nr:NAD-dependent epimerase/dehydratase family protein [Paracoccaceae bacterium]
MSDTGPALVTGAAGFIGQHLCRAILADGGAVRAFVRPDHRVDALAAAGAEILRGDAADPAAMTRAAEGVDTVYHLAAVRGTKKLSRRAYAEGNIALTDAAAGAALAAGARLVAASTVAVMGASPPLSPADGPLAPISSYAASRAAVERRLATAWAGRGLDFRIARIAQRVGGPGARDWRRLVMAVRDGRYRVLPRGGRMHSADVEDVVAGLRLVAGPRGEQRTLYVIAARRAAPVRDHLAAIAEELGVAFAPRPVPGAPFRAYWRLHLWTNSALARELPHGFTAGLYANRFDYDDAGTRDRIGFAPRHTGPDAARRAARWLRAEGLV